MARLGLGVSAQLGGQLRVAGLKQPDERTCGERCTHGLDFGKLIAAPKHVEELGRLTPRPPKRPDLIENHAPRGNREKSENEQDDSGDVAGVGEQVENLRAGPPRYSTVLTLKLQGKERASKRAQAALRDITVRRWDSALRGWGPG